MLNSGAPSLTTESEAKDRGATDVELWLAKIRHCLDEEEAWRKEARLATAVFEARSEGANLRTPVFNIFHSNIQTIVPATYNSTPIPDVRRRFGDKDAQARLGAQIAERLIQSNIDQFDFDHCMRRVVRTACLAGRGVPRIRYEPVIKSPDDPDGFQGETIEHEMVTTEWVAYDRFLHGPAQIWEQVPWVAYLHDLSKDELAKLLEPEPPEMPLAPLAPEMTGVPHVDQGFMDSHQQALEAHANHVNGLAADHEAKVKEAKDRLEQFSFNSSTSVLNEGGKSKPAKGVFKTIPCWEIMDKASRTVIWVTEFDTKLPLAVFPDYLKLSGFFHSPRPLTISDGESSLTPICPHNVYSQLIEEIDDTTRRIKVIIDDMRVRALADPKMQKDLEGLAEAVDGDVVSSSNSELWVQGARAGIANLVMFWPNDQNVAMLKSLMEHREAVKQIIYEVTGISDILRGATNANETLGAQQIKATWGSQRVQELQEETARCAKDVFRMMAEVMFNVFQETTIRNMTLLPEPINAQQIASQVPQPQTDTQTGQQVPVDPQQQAMQQQQMAAQYQQAQQQAIEAAQQQSEEEFAAALAMMRSKLRMFRVDIETDSTIKANQSQNQQQMSTFLQATAQFGQSMAQIAPILPAIVPHLTSIYCSFVRKQKLGKNIEDVLDRLEDASAQPPTLQGQQQDPAAHEQADAQRQHEASQMDKEQSHQRAMAQHDATTQQTALAAVQAKNEGLIQGKALDLEKIRMERAMPPNVPLGGQAQEIATGALA